MSLGSGARLLLVALTFTEVRAEPVQPGPPMRGGHRHGGMAEPPQAAPEPPPADIKDPTLMSPRFREALKQLLPGAGKTTPAAPATPQTEAKPAALPKIRLLAKMETSRKQAGAVLEVDGEAEFVNVGSALSIPAGAHQATLIRVVDINASEVRLEIQAGQQPATLLILR